MRTIEYSEWKAMLEARGAKRIAAELKAKNGYDARARKARLNPAELKVQDEIARRRVD